VLVTGPTGSGKTTTLYSTLKRLATPEVNVCTIEDPIEMIAPEFNQMQVQHNDRPGFAAGVRTLLRQDPDIIMVGEIRDLETAEMAVQAALTGHLVLSTLHTNDAPSAITRLLDLGVPHYLQQGHGARRHGAAPGAHPVPALQAPIWLLALPCVPTPTKPRLATSVLRRLSPARDAAHRVARPAARKADPERDHGRDLSALAEARCIRRERTGTVSSISFRAHGEPMRGASPAQPQQLVVLGMGKLGGANSISRPTST
jgi:energy-coupling factor transporter ATP-binding protein EcfA2